MIRSILAACAALVVAPLPAAAKVAYAPLCAVPGVVVGSPSGTPVPSCGAASGEPAQRADGFRIALRDIANIPMANVTVVLDFSATPVHLLADDRPGTTVDCATHTLRRVTDAAGVVVFAPRFCGGTEEARVRVTADGVWVREIPARSTDLDGDGRTGLSDFQRVARNFMDGTIDGTTDFDPCTGPPGLTTLGDFALFGAELERDAAGTACP